MRVALLALAVATAIPATSAFAASDRRCPDLSRYDVSNTSVRNGTLDRALQRILSGTAWNVEFTGPATDIGLTLIGVSGPMDMVVEKVIERAGDAEVVESISSIVDRESCTIRVSVTTKSPTPSVLVEDSANAAFTAAVAPAPVEPGPGERVHVLPGGAKLSDALTKYVEAYGWTMRWRIEDDFLIDTAIPVPEGDVVEGVLHVIRAYQAAGAMQTVRPRFAGPNKVVVIESIGDQQ